MTDAAAAPKAKKERTPEQAAQRDVQRAISRALWRIDETHKGASTKDKKESWSAGRQKYMTDAKKLAKALTREGVTITAPAAKAKGGDAETATD